MTASFDGIDLVEDTIRRAQRTTGKDPVGDYPDPGVHTACMPYGVYGVYMNGTYAIGNNATYAEVATELMVCEATNEVGGDGTVGLKVLQYSLPTGTLSNYIGPSDITPAQVATDVHVLPNSATSVLDIVWDGIGWWFISAGSVLRRIIGSPHLDESLNLSVGNCTSAVYAAGHLWVTSTNATSQLLRVQTRVDPGQQVSEAGAFDLGITGGARAIAYHDATKTLFLAMDNGTDSVIRLQLNAEDGTFTQTGTINLSTSTVGIVVQEATNTVYVLGANAIVYELNAVGTMAIQSQVDSTLDPASLGKITITDPEGAAQFLTVSMDTNNKVVTTTTTGALSGVDTHILGDGAVVVQTAALGGLVFAPTGPIGGVGDADDGKLIWIDREGGPQAALGSVFKVWRQPGAPVAKGGDDTLFTATSTLAAGSYNNYDLLAGASLTTLESDAAYAAALEVTGPVVLTGLRAPPTRTGVLHLTNSKDSLAPITFAPRNASSDAKNQFAYGSAAVPENFLLYPGQTVPLVYSPFEGAWTISGGQRQELWPAPTVENSAFNAQNGVLHRVDLGSGDLTITLDLLATTGLAPAHGDRFGVHVTRQGGVITIDTSSTVDDLIVDLDALIIGAPGVAHSQVSTLSNTATSRFFEFIYRVVSGNPNVWELHRVTDSPGDCIITDTLTAALTNNWNPSENLDLEDANVFTGRTYVIADADGVSYEVSGLSGVQSYIGKLVTVIVLGSKGYTFLHSSASSDAASRMTLPGAVDLHVAPTQSVTFMRIGNAASGEWVVVSTTANNVALETTDDSFGADQNDFEPDEWQLGASHIRVLVANDIKISGFGPPGGSIMKTLIFPNSNIATLQHQNANSLAANRIVTPDGNDMAMANGSVTMLYDTVDNVWRVLGYSDDGEATFLTGANQNNMDPPAWEATKHLRINTSADFDITGFLAATTIKHKRLYFVGPDTVTLKHQDGLSDPANRLTIPGGVNIDCEAGDIYDLYYDTTSTTWRVG